MQNLASIITGILLLLSEALLVDLFGVSTWYPHFAIGIIVYLALERELVDGCVCVIVLAWTAELLSGSPPGATALALSILFLIVRVSASRLSYRAFLVRFGLAIAAAIGFHVLQVMTLIASGHSAFYLKTLVFEGIPSCLFAPIGLLISWFIFERIDGIFKRRKNIFKGT